MDINDLSSRDIELRLLALEEVKPHNPYPQNLLDGPEKQAAVLIPLVREQNAWHILFIRRTEIPGDRHSGQVAFPGGACDPIDGNAVEAALRESQEELGIDPADVKVSPHCTVPISYLAIIGSAVRMGISSSFPCATSKQSNELQWRSSRQKPSSRRKPGFCWL